MFGGGRIWSIYSFRAFGEKSLIKMKRSAKRLLIVSTNLDGFSLVNDKQYAKFTKPPPPPPNFPAIQYTKKILHSYNLAKENHVHSGLNISNW